MNHDMGSRRSVAVMRELWIMTSAAWHSWENYESWYGQPDSHGRTESWHGQPDSHWRTMNCDMSSMGELWIVTWAAMYPGGYERTEFWCGQPGSHEKTMNRDMDSPAVMRELWIVTWVAMIVWRLWVILCVEMKWNIGLGSYVKPNLNWVPGNLGKWSWSAEYWPYCPLSACWPIQMWQQTPYTYYT